MVSPWVGRILDADVNVVFADYGDWLILADVAVKSFKVQVVAVYVPDIASERAFIFQQLAPFLDDPKRSVLVGDWNAILDPEIHKVGRGTSKA